METTVYVNFTKIKACLDTSSYRIIDDLVRDPFLSSSKKTSDDGTLSEVVSGDVSS